MKSPYALFSLLKQPVRTARFFAAVLLGAAGARAQVPNTLHHTLLSPATTPQGTAQFGQRVLLTDAYVIISAPLADTLVADAGQVFVYDKATGALLHTINNPAPGVSDQFGYAMTISGNRLVVGVPADDPPGAFPNRGTVYVYDLGSPAPTEPVLTISHPFITVASRGGFGRSVALSGNRLLVGECTVNSFEKGSAHYYDLSSATPASPVLSLIAEGSTDNYGTAVALEGTRAVVGAPRNDNGAVDAGSVYVYELSSPTPGTPILTLRNPAPVQSDFFGASLAMSGTRILVGSPLKDSPDTGHAWLFDTAGLTPSVPVIDFPNPAPHDDDNFGIDVAISGDTILIGSQFDTVGTFFDAGALYVYNLNHSPQNEPVLKVENPNPADTNFVTDGFAAAVAVRGSEVVVGAYLEDSPGAANAGIAYMYNLAGQNAATPVRTINCASLRTGDAFGSSVAVSGTRAVVAAPNALALGNGSVFTYDLSGPSPVLTALTNPNLSFGFGWSVAISGSKIVVGTRVGSGISEGQAHIFDMAGATPSVAVLKLSNPAPTTSDFFGHAVAISGNRVVIGAPQEDTAGADTGTAYVFDLSSATPGVPVYTLNNPTPADSDNFGYAVAIDGNRVAVGAIGDDTGAVDAGCVYVYDLGGATPTVPVTKNNPAPAEGDQFGNAIVIVGNRMAVAASRDDAGAIDAGTVYAYDLTSAAAPATLLNPAPAEGDLFGSSLSLSAATLLVGASGDDATAVDGGTAYVFDIGSATPTVPLGTLNNPTPNDGDNFGAAVAISGVTGLLGAPGDDLPLQNKGAAYIYGLERPEIAVAQPANANILDGGGKTFGAVRIGEPVSLTFTLRNTGTSPLTDILLSSTGTHAAEFQVTTPPPATVAPGGTSSFIVRFNPVASGIRTATLQIASNDFDENPFDINVTGQAFSVSEDFDGDGLNDWAEYQLVAQGFDWRVSQPALVSGFFTGANSAGLYSQSQLEAIHTTPLLGKDPVTGEFLITLRLEKSTNLTNFSLFPATGPQVTVNAQGEMVFRFPAPGNISFFKLQQR